MPKHLRRRREHQHAADDPADFVQAELEPGRDAEVPAAAANRPEQVRLTLLVDLAHLPVGRDDLRSEQAVDGEPMEAAEEADASAERDPADPDGRGVAEAGGEAVLADGVRVLAGRQPGLGPGGARLGVDLDSPHVAEVDHDAVLDQAVTRGAVASAADGQRRARVTRERDDPRDLGGIARPDDRRRPDVDSAGEDEPGGVVVAVVGADHPVLVVRTQLLEGRGIGE